MEGFEWSKICYYEDTVTACVIVFFSLLLFIQIFIGKRYVKKRMKSSVKARGLVIYTLILDVITITVGMFANKLPVGFLISSYPAWYPLYMVVVIAFIGYNSSFCIFIVLGSILAKVRTWKNRRKLKRKVQEK